MFQTGQSSKDAYGKSICRLGSARGGGKEWEKEGHHILFGLHYFDWPRPNSVHS